MLENILKEIAIKYLSTMKKRNEVFVSNAISNNIQVDQELYEREIITRSIKLLKTTMYYKNGNMKRKWRKI